MGSVKSDAHFDKPEPYFELSDLVNASRFSEQLGKDAFIWQLYISRPVDLIVGDYAAKVQRYFNERGAVVLGKSGIMEPRFQLRSGTVLAVLGPESLFPQAQTTETWGRHEKFASEREVYEVSRMVSLGTFVMRITGMPKNETLKNSSRCWTEIAEPAEINVGERIFGGLALAFTYTFGLPWVASKACKYYFGGGVEEAKEHPAS